jgi:hypothetical protein
MTIITVPDEMGGAIIAWADSRTGKGLFAQRITASGDTLWAANGNMVCSATVEYGAPLGIHAAGDGTGGAIIVWTDSRTVTWEIYAQRIDPDGTMMWTANGVNLSPGHTFAWVPKAVADEAGGAIVGWGSYLGTGYGVFMQRVSPSGDKLWATEGIKVSGQWTYMLELASDGAGGCIASWISNDTLFAQRVNASGALMWPEPLVVAAAADMTDLKIVSNDDSGTIVTWADKRGADFDIHAQRISSNGEWGYSAAPVITAVEDVPNDQGGQIQIQWSRSYLDTIPNTEIIHYSVWRRMPELPALELPAVPPAVESLPLVPADHEGPAPLCMYNGYAWQWLVTVPARYFELYSAVVPSLYDSTGIDAGWQYFMVSAQTDTQFVFYDSAVDSGYSVDNLAPCVPQGLAGEQSFIPEGLALAWDPGTEPDLSHYRVYRGPDETFVPGPGTLIASPTDPAHFDGDWRWDGGYYYKIAAVDVHGNESQYALLGPDGITGDEGSTTPRVTTLGQNYPNPFNPSTRIAFGLATRGHVRLCIYDASGRLVRTLVDESRAAGRYEEAWDGRDGHGHAAASGIYLYRLDAGAFTETRKMVLLR